MWITFQHQGRYYRANLSKPLDIAIPLREGLETVNCFYAPPMETSPVVAGDFVGSTAQGGPLNFLNVRLNPHGNGTHTECVGHIAKEPYTINQSLKQFHFPALLVSIFPTKTDGGDRVIFREQLEEAMTETPAVEALLLRTLPNDELKLRTNYSGANPPYVHHEAIRFLVEKGIRHLLLDLPSVDREEDGGKLLAHRAFWAYPEAPRTNCTITELIFVNNSIKDGLYLLNIQIASFEIDVSPSKPVLYELEPV
ncbi:MAG: cyclase family protein [Phaeodactylibacter sp.]|nr:cyclase family protein [Phaeodactylibacter sp.]MCB9052921.1 cyclase family protein [Lewinellaceae bacterium]